MANRRSTVYFTDVIEPLLRELEMSGFNLKAIVNGGIFLFSKLSGDEQKKAIAKANALPQSKSSQKEALKNAIKVIKEMTEVERQQPGTIYRVLNIDEQQAIDDFRKAISPKPKKTARKKTGG